jgi:hypothetical protein
MRAGPVVRHRRRHLSTQTCARPDAPISLYIGDLCAPMQKLDMTDRRHSMPDDSYEAYSAKGLPIDARWPIRCQNCVPDLDCIFVAADDDDEDNCGCPGGARCIALDVRDTACLLGGSKVDLKDRAAVEAAVLAERSVDFIERAIEGGRLDDLIDRAIICALIPPARPVGRSHLNRGR